MNQGRECTFKHLQAEPGRPSARIGCAASFLWKAILLKTSYWGVGNVVLKGVSAVLPLWIRISLRVCELLKKKTFSGTKAES